MIMKPVSVFASEKTGIILFQLIHHNDSTTDFRKIPEKPVYFFGG